MRTAGALLCILIILAGMTGAVSAQADAEGTNGQPELVYEIEVQPDGDARWSIEARFPTHTTAQEEAFERLAVDFEEDEGETFLSIEPYQRATDSLARQLDRSMAIAGENRTVNRSEDVGRLVVSFRWTNFGAIDGETIHIGDVFNEGQYAWFPRLGPQETLLIRPPANYTVERSGVPIVDRVMRVAGPAELERGQLKGTFRAPRVIADGDNGEAVPFGPIVGGLIGLAGGALAVFLLTSFGSAFPLGAPENEDRPAAEHEAPAEEAADGPEPTEDTLLSDEERVLELIRSRDGRMKQAAIVNETDWSNAKVSQLLSQMAEDEQIEKLRIGRENLIRIPQEESGEDR